MSAPDAALAEWIGRSQTLTDTVTATPVAALAATLDRPAEAVSPGTALPPLWHWLYFPPCHRQSEIGADGHARRGGFLPPVPLPRRMWAGGRFEFRSPTRVGDRVTRTSRRIRRADADVHDLQRRLPDADRAVVRGAAARRTS
jgi:3-methylfumaryl-CoA hydratase